jgi:hypothetical protein
MIKDPENLPPESALQRYKMGDRTLFEVTVDLYWHFLEMATSSFQLRDRFATSDPYDYEEDDTAVVLCFYSFRGKFYCHLNTVSGCKRVHLHRHVKNTFYSNLRVYMSKPEGDSLEVKGRVFQHKEQKFLYLSKEDNTEWE